MGRATRSASPAGKKSKLTPALAKRASALAHAARPRPLKQAREDVAGQGDGTRALELADATRADDSPQKIDAKALGKLDPARATVRELQQLAQKERGKTKASPRGRTTTAEERALAAKLQAALRKAGAKVGTVHRRR